MKPVAEFLHAKVAETLGSKIEDVNPTDEFMSLGLDSMHAIFLIDELEMAYAIQINPHDFWEYPTIKSFSENLEKKIAAKSAHP